MSATDQQTEAQAAQDQEPTEEEKFRQQQQSQAEAQNLYGDNAVPEQRPQATQQVDTSASPLTQRLIEEGEIEDPAKAEPMGKEAYDRAASDAQRKKAEKAERQPAVHAASVIKILDGPHRGRTCSILRIIGYESREDRLRRLRGDAESNFAAPDEVEVSFRGDDRDGERAVLELSKIEYELVPSGYAGRASGRGAL